MQPELEIITKEIPAKGKAYIIVRRCPPEGLDAATGSRSGAESGGQPALCRVHGSGSASGGGGEAGLPADL